MSLQWTVKAETRDEPPHDKTNKMVCAPSEDSDQPGHPPSLTWVFPVCMKKAWVLSYSLSAQRRLWLDWTDAQADLSLRWAHSNFIGFVVRRLRWCQILSHVRPQMIVMIAEHNHWLQQYVSSFFCFLHLDLPRLNSKFSSSKCKYTLIRTPISRDVLVFLSILHCVFLFTVSAELF